MKETKTFVSRFKGLGIKFKSYPKNPTTGTAEKPSEFIQFQNGKFITDDPEKIAFLKGLKSAAGSSYGVDFWLIEETDKYVKQLPKDAQTATIIEAKDSIIEDLKRQLEMASGKRQPAKARDENKE